MGIVLRLLGSAAGPWILLGLVAALAVSHAAVYINGHGNGVAKQELKYSRAANRVAADIRRSHEKELKERGWQDATDAASAAAARSDLQNRLAELALLPPKVLIQTKVVRDETGCSVPVPSLGADFWLRYRTAGSERGSEADPPAAGRLPSQM